MCKRILLTTVSASGLATFSGVKYQKVSFDSRCEMTTDYNEKLHAFVLSFANSDKPGVVIINPGKKFEDGTTAEFTDVVPDDALIIEFVEPAAAE